MYVLVQPEPHKAKDQFQVRIPSSRASHSAAGHSLLKIMLVFSV